MFHRKKANNAITDSIPRDINNALLDICSHLSVTKEKQKEFYHFFSNFYTTNKTKIEQFVKDGNGINKLLEQAIYELKNIRNIVAKNKTKITGITFLGMLAPAAANIANSTSTELTIVNGPGGGVDLCNGYLKCVQGYLMNADQQIITNFNAFMNLAGKVNWGAMWVFDQCFNANTVGNIVKNIISQDSNNGLYGNITSPCTSSYSNSANYANVGSITQPLNQAQCLAYQNSFQALTQECLTDGKIVGFDWAIAAMFILPILVCACIIMARVCCCK